MNGFVFLDKPEEITSFTAVNKVRRICSEKKAGHTGTLDPMATGVLPIMFGGATRFSQYLPSHNKTYRATILLGTVTDTLDVTGKIIETHEVNVTNEQLENVLQKFTGNIKQYPPMYSAVSKDGVRLYKLARQGIEVEREARDVTIYSLELQSKINNNEFTIDVECSSGTYIRSLAADIGDTLDCGAVISSLRRTKANGIDISRTVTLEKLSEIVASNKLESILIGVDEMLSFYTSISVSEKQAIRFYNGGELDTGRIKGDFSDGLYRVHSPDGRLLGLGKAVLQEKTLYVEKILVE